MRMIPPRSMIFFIVRNLHTHSLTKQSNDGFTSIVQGACKCLGFGIPLLEGGYSFTKGIGSNDCIFFSQNNTERIAFIGIRTGLQSYCFVVISDRKGVTSRSLAKAKALKGIFKTCLQYLRPCFTYYLNSNGDRLSQPLKFGAESK